MRLHLRSVEGVEIEAAERAASAGRWSGARDHRAGPHAANVFDALAAHCRRRDVGQPALGGSGEAIAYW